jgi:CMP-N-acetylneuraminic acid synthetase
MNLLTLICAREGSKGLKNKNIKLFNKKPLIYYTIKKALSSKYVNEVYVSTDSTKISKVAKNFGAKVKFIRNKNLSKDTSPELMVWRDAILRLEKLNNTNYDYICVLPVTAPLRSVKDIDDCINIFQKKKCDGVITITPSSKNPYFNMVKISNDGLRLINKSKKLFFNRQKAPKVYDITTVAYIMSTNFIKKKNSIFQGKLEYKIIPKNRSIDIDDINDFKIAEYLYQKK